MLDVIDECCQALLVRRGQPRFDILGIEPCVSPRDSDYWDIDIGKDVRGRAENHGWTQQENEQRQDDERIRSIESQSHNPHNLVFASRRLSSASTQLLFGGSSLSFAAGSPPE